MEGEGNMEGFHPELTVERAEELLGFARKRRGNALVTLCG